MNSASHNPKVATVASLIDRYPLISEQVSKAQVQVILTKLEQVLSCGTPGAVVEFGCYIGTTSLFIRRLLDVKGLSSHIRFHVYDSFEGLPAKSTQDASAAGEQFTAGELAVSRKQFLAEFHKARLTPPIVHKGWFSALGPADLPAEVAFAFLDGDFYESIRDSLRLVLPRMQAGGVIVVDDYAREALPGAAKAVNEVFRPEQITTTHNLGVIRLT